MSQTSKASKLSEHNNKLLYLVPIKKRKPANEGMPLSDGFSDLCLQPACCQAAVAAEVVKPFRYEWADCCSHVPTCADAFMGLFLFACWVLRIIFSEVRRLEP